MNIWKHIRPALVGLAAGVCVGLPAHSEIVANLGTLIVGSAELVSCTTSTCTTSAGTVGGSLPASGAFTHQIVFNVSPSNSAIASNQVLLSTSIDVANMSVSLFEHNGVSQTAVGGTAVGTLLVTAAKSTFETTTNFFLQVGALDPLKTYFIEIFGGGLGVQASNAIYAQQVAVFNDGGGPGPSPVPLPAALPLLLAALGAFGLLGWRRRRARAVAA